MHVLSDAVLQAYAALFVRFAIGGGSPLSRGAVVQLTIPDPAKPLLEPLIREVLRSGAHPKIRFLPSGIDRAFFEEASDEQLRFFPDAYKRAEADLLDAHISIIAEDHPRELVGIDPTKVFLAGDARRVQREWLFQKELLGKFRWTLGLFGTQAMASEAGASIEEYWDQIIRACYLDTPDPIAEWKRVIAEIDRIKTALNMLEIESVHVEAEGIDLTVRIGRDRCWLGGSLRNIPSFEIFTSPDWRGTQGTIAFDQPLFRYGSVLRGIRLSFVDGCVVSAHADEGNDVLSAMIRRTNADKIGEFSLTDRRFSRIDRFMASTLFDENFGGPHGNTHVALGRAYREAFRGDGRSLREEEWSERGFNDSPEHTDIISATDRIVTARCGDGTSKVIYRNGEFVV